MLLSPAKVLVNDNDVDIEAKFSVDRTSWGLRYGAEGDRLTGW
jgi:hypothetical protein